jgi:hypothetical protein
MTQTDNFNLPFLGDWFTPYATQDSSLLGQLNFLPGLKELLMLRQVHALEHATVWVLSETNSPEQNNLRADNETLGGFSTDSGFYLYGQIQPRDLQRAVRIALERLQGGQWHLAIHPRCGTNASVTMMVTAGFVLGAHFLLPRGPVEQLIGLGVAFGTAVQVAPDLGGYAQKYLTTAIPFNLELVNVVRTTDFWGRSAHFVSVRWQDLQ